MDERVYEHVHVMYTCVCVCLFCLHRCKTVFPGGFLHASSVPGGSVGKESTYNPGDSGMGRSLGEGNGNPL